MVGALKFRTVHRKKVQQDLHNNKENLVRFGSYYKLASPQALIEAVSLVWLRHISFTPFWEDSAQVLKLVGDSLILQYTSTNITVGNLFCHLYIQKAYGQRYGC